MFSKPIYLYFSNKCTLIFILTCISLMTNKIHHLFMLIGHFDILLWNDCSSLLNLNRENLMHLHLFHWLVGVLYVLSVWVINYTHHKYFPPPCNMLFHSSSSVLVNTGCNFVVVQFIIVFLYGSWSQTSVHIQMSDISFSLKILIVWPFYFIFSFKIDFCLWYGVKLRIPFFFGICLYNSPSSIS